VTFGNITRKLEEPNFDILARHNRFKSKKLQGTSRLFATPMATTTLQDEMLNHSYEIGLNAVQFGNNWMKKNSREF